MRRWSLLVAVLTLVADLAAQTAPPASAPAVIPFTEGEPASLWWDGPTATLFIADNENNQIWSWTDRDGLKRAGITADATNAKPAGSVGQLVRLPDGRLVVMRFGRPGGGIGGIVTLDPTSGTSVEVANLDRGRRRLGLAVSMDGKLFGSYFGSAPGGGLTSTLTSVDVGRGETDLAGGFRKIVGVVAAGDTLFVSDQMADSIYAVPSSGTIPPAGERRIVAKLPRPDQIALGPDGSLFTGQFQAAPGSSEPLSVRQVMKDGSVKIIASDPDVSRPSGVAYDPKGRRLFVANGGNPSQCFVRIIPIG